MSSRSGDSDIHPDRIQAREDHHRRGIQFRCESPVESISIDLIELGSIGAHLEVPEHESWPPSLELTDHEAQSDSPILTTMTTDTIINLRRDLESGTAGRSPISRACTPERCVPYLPLHEYEELQRQRSASSKTLHSASDNLMSRRRRISVATTIEPGTQNEVDEHDEDNHVEPHRTYFSNHTPSHGSRDLTDKEEGSEKNAGPSSPEPWSQFGRTIGTSDCRGLQS